MCTNTIVPSSSLNTFIIAQLVIYRSPDKFSIYYTTCSLSNFPSILSILALPSVCLFNIYVHIFLGCGWRLYLAHCIHLWEFELNESALIRVFKSWLDCRETLLDWDLTPVKVKTCWHGTSTLGKATQLEFSSYAYELIDSAM